ncbi:hypothetical protein [Lyngbya sp. PCC 8106]|nr:hypothetical protein [Lyngbya sp. PCC 8106]
MGKQIGRSPRGGFPQRFTGQCSRVTLKAVPRCQKIIGFRQD